MKKLINGENLRRLCLFCLMILMSRANICDVIDPFCYAFAFALVACGQSPLFVAIVYFVSSVMFRLSFQGVMISLMVFVGLMLVFFIQRFTKRQLPVYLIFLIMLVSQSAKLYFSISNALRLFETLICIFVGVVSFYVFVIGTRAIFKRARKWIFTLDEKISLSCMAIILFSGVSGINFGYFDFTKMVCVFCLFLISRIFEPFVTLIFSTLMGIGICLTHGVFDGISILFVFASIMAIFKNNNKYLVSIMVMAGDVILYACVNMLEISILWSIFPVVIGLLLVCFIPKNNISYLTVIMNRNCNIIGDYLREISSKELRQKILDISKTFLQMENVYRKLLIGPIDRTLANDIIVSELVSKHCSRCVNYKKCFFAEIDMKSACDTLVHAGIFKGKVTLVDIPSLMSGECEYLQNMVSATNSVIAGFNALVSETQEKDRANVQVADQLGSTAFLLGKFADKYNKTLRVDEQKSNELIDELLFFGIGALESKCLISENGIDSVFVVIESKDILNPVVVEVLNRVFSVKFTITDRKTCEIPGVVILIARPCGNFEIRSGIATSAKIQGTDSGDSYAISKIDEHKYLFAISDGKGSGRHANAISVATISLIENFYKVGFSSEIIASSVNQLLLPAGKENFSCLDAGVIDIESGRCDFIKIGSSVSVIKGQKKSQMIECESLPLGIIGQIKPTTESVYLEDQDILVMASDGIVDCFASPETFFEFVKSENISNPQLLASCILDEANARRRGEKDDMTVLVAKIIQK